VVEVDGVRLRTLRLGPAPSLDRPPWVLLHEGLGSLAQWKDFPQALQAATGRAVFAYERQGHGGSDPWPGPRPLDFLEREAYARLPQLLEVLGWDRVLLFGHSDGGSIALAFGAAHPDRVEALVTEAAHVILEPLTLAGLEVARKAFEAGPLRRGLEAHHGAGTEALFRGWNNTWLHPERRTWNLCPALATLRAPLLALQGELDEYGSPEQLRLIAASVAGPVQTCLLPGCRHVPHFQAREAVLEALKAFLQK